MRTILLATAILSAGAISAQNSQPEAIFVKGEVQRPGVYPASQEMTVLSAITNAGGLTKAAESNVEIERKIEGTNLRARIHVDVKDIQSGKVPDIPLRAWDVIVVLQALPEPAR
jgi:polysaccharide biosynthesis/export protein